MFYTHCMNRDELEKLPTSPKAAKAIGSRIYFSGKLCRDNHLSPRQTSSMRCVECRRLATVRDREKLNLTSRVYYRANREEIIASQQRRRQENGNAWQRKYRDANRDSLAEANRKWKADNPERMRANNALRRARKAQATPIWVSPPYRRRESDADRARYAAIRARMQAEMQAFYDEAERLEQLTGIPRHVDHIIPITHPLHCGLHVPWNLQVLTCEENCRKHNRLPEAAEKA